MLLVRKIIKLLHFGSKFFIAVKSGYIRYEGKVLVQWLELLFCIEKVLGLICSPEASYSTIKFFIFSSVQTDTWIMLYCSSPRPE
jgi:hypothetical protein